MSARGAFLFVAALLLGATVHALDKPSKYVTDKAGVMPANRLQALNEALAGFERETSNQIVVYVDRRLPQGTTLEDLASTTFRSWGIGQKDRSNGALFLVFIDDRAMRIEVGYGLEGAITDLLSRRITSELVKPFFKKGDYAGGIEAGTRALMAAARGEGYKGKGRTAAESARSLDPAGLLGMDSAQPVNLAGLLATLLAGVVPFVIGLVRRRSTGRRPLGILASSCALAASVAFASALLTAHPLFWALAVVLFVSAFVLGIVNVIFASPGTGGASTSSSWTTDTGGSSSWSSSDSSSSDSSSSSDFSGGGGDSGGGGSSDSW